MEVHAWRLIEGRKVGKGKGGSGNTTNAWCLMFWLVDEPVTRLIRSWPEVLPSKEVGLALFFKIPDVIGSNKSYIGYECTTENHHVEVLFISLILTFHGA